MGAVESISILVELTDDPIDIDRISAFLRCPEGGAIDMFIGTTRGITDLKETTHLAYEAAPDLAEAEIRRIVEEASARWPILRTAVVHRLGTVPVMEASVVMGVSTPHRADSFEACKFLIDTLKARVPIWKKEQFADGSTEWVQGSVPE